MNLPWQQPIRPLEVKLPDDGMWVPVLFIRPKTSDGWQVITHAGVTWSNDDLRGIREVAS
jgi:hypothetical protein